MLVLTRKVDEQILIGDDIKITLIRVRGNSVRIGIEAPRSIRVARGELGKLEAGTKTEASPAVSSEVSPEVIEVELEGEIDDLAEVFAHPESVRMGNRGKQTIQDRLAEATKKPEVFVGSVRRSGAEARLSRAPLANFVSAS